MVNEVIWSYIIVERAVETMNEYVVPELLDHRREKQRKRYNEY